MEFTALAQLDHVKLKTAFQIKIRYVLVNKPKVSAVCVCFSSRLIWSSIWTWLQNASAKLKVSSNKWSMVLGEFSTHLVDSLLRFCNVKSFELNKCWWKCGGNKKLAKCQRILWNFVTQRDILFERVIQFDKAKRLSLQSTKAHFEYEMIVQHIPIIKI